MINLIFHHLGCMRTVWDPPRHPDHRRMWLLAACAGLAFAVGVALLVVVVMVWL
jgi:hypothetical protein